MQRLQCTCTCGIINKTHYLGMFLKPMLNVLVLIDIT